MKNLMTIKMDDGSTWGVPIEVIARHRENFYANKFNGDIEESLKQDTIPFFEEDEYNIEDWASNNMNWDDVKKHAMLIESGNVDYQEGWINGEKGFVQQ